ncbi:hypothetical protein D5F01_LYC14209 [Larimichthys crocea]|uniref:Uncharacterized protein n=1 Tax=Larimichthys crocea TaxID=215358 RepID=A0A6G0I9E1_LARCR|nr:hypothetical protein D5F01_LYC14209 [Larimichthys crocea]
MSWTDRIRTQVGNITGRTERERLQRQVEELQDELHTVNSNLTHALTDLESQEISNYTLKEQLASVRNELFWEQVRRYQEEQFYRKELDQQRSETMEIIDRNKKLQDQLEDAEKEIKRMRDDRNMMAQHPGEDEEEQSSASDEADVDRSTSALSEAEEKAEEQSSISDYIEADVDRSTSASPITEETAEEQSSASDYIEAETDERRPPSIAPEPDFDQHLTVVSQDQSTEASTSTARGAQRTRTFWKRVRDFFFRKRNKKKRESEPNTNRDNTTLTER